MIDWEIFLEGLLGTLLGVIGLLLLQNMSAERRNSFTGAQIIRATIVGLIVGIFMMFYAFVKDN